MKKWKCKVCGYVHTGDEPPEKCPICGVPKEMFEEIVEAASETELVRESTEEEKPATKVEEVESVSFITNLVMKFHVHPIAVHTPNGVLPIALVFLLLAAVMNVESLETAGFYNLVFVLLAMPVVLLTGIVAWKTRYGAAFTNIFKVKIAASFTVTTLLLILVCWRLIVPDVMGPESSMRWIYIALTLVMVAVVGLAGHLGGKLVFDSRD